MLTLGAMLIFAGIIIFIAAVAQAVHNRSYAKASENVIGIVVGKRKRTVKNGSSYELTVNYNVDGVEYEKVVGAALSEFETISEGDKLELRYNPANPQKAVREKTLNPTIVRNLLLIGIVLTFTGALLFVLGRIL